MRTEKQIFIAALLSALSLPAQALQNLSIPDNGTGAAKISLKEVNRITVTNGRVRNVFAADGSLKID
ncbi:MAG: type-F conjugative transfer system secretin TraK, partial [Proteobacteria bacterium]|nr:type-F conjugative transfer system secretin TraK [Pseudomonadota bacterium]